MAKTLTLHRWIDQENLTLDVELVAENPNMIGTFPTSPLLSIHRQRRRRCGDTRKQALPSITSG